MMLVAFLDLNREKVKELELEDSWIGGIGAGTKLLLDLLPTKADPLSPKNLLVLAPGGLVGAPFFTANRLAVLARSPLTGMLGFGLVGGYFGYEFRRTGYGALVVSGRAKRPVWIKISNGIQLHDAAKLWGADCYQTEAALRKEGEVLSIGPAGENQVRIASMNHRRHKAVGRTGMGAVAGSKQIKAFVARGTKKIKVAKPTELASLNRQLFAGALGPKMQKYRNFGTCGSVDAYYKLGIMPSYNRTRLEMPGWQGLTAKYFKRICIAELGCALCNVNCRKVCSRSGATADYEAMYALGFNLGICDAAKVMVLKGECDRLGLDVISAGNALALIMDLYRARKLGVQDIGFETVFGDVKAAAKLLRDIAKKRGIGAALAEGPYEFARKRGWLNYVSSNKGMTLPGFEIRALHSAALGFALSPRGGCHLRSGAYAIDIPAKRSYRLGYSLDRVDKLIALEDFYALIDSLGVCKFARKLLPPDVLARAWSLVHGADIGALAGERIWNAMHALNLKLGWKPADAWPNIKDFKSSIRDKFRAPKLDRRKYSLLLRHYFKRRGWTVNGKITAAKRRKLGL